MTDATIIDDSRSPRRRHARIDELREILRRHNEEYYLRSRPSIGDREYDALKEELRALEAVDDRPVPADSPTRQVGAPVDGDDDTEAHPEPMLSIENVTSDKELRKFLTGVPRRLQALRDEARKNGRDEDVARLDAALAEPVRFVVEMKIDGVSIALRYAEGRLVQALTRGDKRRGRKVLATVGQIPGIPPRQTRFPDGTVRGEIQFPRASFAELRDDPRLRPFKNERNAASGLVNGIVNASELVKHLRLFAYAVVHPREAGLKTQMEIHRALREAGFPPSPVVVSCPDADAVLAARDRLDRERWDLPFRTDGLVVKVDSLAQQEALGHGETAPHWARAYKFPESEAETTLRRIRVQVGKSGRLTPVGEFDPVLLDGSTIARASLHNASRIDALDLREGDRILVHKAKEIIPQVVASLPEYRPPDARPFHMPEACPECGGPVREEINERAAGDGGDESGGAEKSGNDAAGAGAGAGAGVGVVRFHYCVNPDCAGRLRERLVHFGARGAMDIDGFGEKVIEALWDRGYIRDVADLFDLTREQLMTLTKAGEEQLAKENASTDAEAEKNNDTDADSDAAADADSNDKPAVDKADAPAGLFGDIVVPAVKKGRRRKDAAASLPLVVKTPKSVENQLAALEAAKGRGLARVLAALAIPNVGETVAQHVARYFGSMQRLQAATADEIAAIPAGESATYRTLGRRGAKMFNDALAAPGRREQLLKAVAHDEASAASVAELTACLQGFDIKGAGPEKCAAVARHFGTARRLLDASADELELVEMGAGVAVRTLGPVVGRSLRDFLDLPAHRALIQRLADAGLRLTALPVPGRRRRPGPAEAGAAQGDLFAATMPGAPGTPDAPDASASAINDNNGDAGDFEGEASPLAGRNVVLTGSLAHVGRSEAKRLLEAAGAIVSGSVGAGTDYLIVGDKPGSKLDNAKKRGVPVIDEAEMFRLLGIDPPPTVR